MPIQCIEHIEQPIDDADEIHNKSLARVLDFFSSKLHPYYLSFRALMEGDNSVARIILDKKPFGG